MKRFARMILPAAALLSACGAPGPRPSTGAAAPAAIGIPGHAAMSVRPIDSARSYFSVRVYRAGPLARLGHNHVIVAGRLDGTVSFGDDPSAASLALSIPSAELIVDDAAARAGAGADFADPVPDDARTGTRRNLLSPALLDAGRFSAIGISGAVVRRSATGASLTATVPLHLTATVTLDVAGHRSTVEAPFALQAVAGGLVASGTLVLRQSSLGLTPFSIMLGALQVRDEFSVEYRFFVPTAA